MYITKNGTNIATDMYISGSASGTFEATRATVTTSATAISLNTVAFNTALNGTLNFQANYITGELASKSYLTTA
jgi:broad specificity polyphosphatase/5'/3'-nucleotidase SurE